MFREAHSFSIKNCLCLTFNISQYRAIFVKSLLSLSAFKKEIQTTDMIYLRHRQTEKQANSYFYSKPYYICICRSFRYEMYGRRVYKCITQHD